MAVKIILGLLFIISALAKFFSIDSFEIYVFSFGMMSLPISLYASRILMAFELLLGVALVSNRYHRFTTVVTLLFVLFFIVFLSYVQLIGRTDSCHCFGELLPFNPVQSLLKNVVMLVLLLFVYKYAPADWSPRWWMVLVLFLLLAVTVALYFLIKFRFIDLLTMGLLAVVLAMAITASFAFFGRWFISSMIAVAPFVAVFVFSPPDNLMFKETDEHFDVQLFRSSVVVGDDVDDAAVADSLLCLGSGRQIVAFFSPTCGYCLLAGEKLSTIVTRNGLDMSRVQYVFPDTKKRELVDEFYEESRSADFRRLYLDKRQFIRISRGAFPLVLCVEDGEVVASMGYRNISEKVIVEFLK